MDVEDARFLLTMAAILIAGLLAAVAAGSQPFRRHADRGFGFRWVKRYKVARTLPHALGRRSSALGGSFADVSGAFTDVATGTGLIGLLSGGGLRCARGLLRLRLAVLTEGALAGDGNSQYEDRE